VSAICRELGLPDASRTEVEASEVKEKIRLDHLKFLKAEMAGKEKLAILSQCDTRQAQEYVGWTLEEARMAFRLQTRMFNCRGNMPSRYRRDLVCRACIPDGNGGLEAEETQDHLELCRGYSELWLGLGPLTPRSRVRYFIRVNNKRTKMNK
jgi:hypothetical protein